MPKLNDETMDAVSLPNNSFGYSATRLESLEAFEYTLVTLVVDRSGSVQGYQSSMEDCIKEVIGACKMSPKADNLMLRAVLFDDKLEELHGYKLLQNCNLDDYTGCIEPRGLTALYDATKASIDATIDYARDLTDNDYSVNSIVIIITDGWDNRSSFTPNSVQESLASAVKTESMESIRTILVGVDTMSDPQLSAKLQEFRKTANIDQYEDIANANAKSLAKLADFISKSISAQSQALGSGGPSKPISLSI